VGGYSKQRKIKQAKFSGQTILLNGNPCYYRHSCQVKRRAASRIP